MSFKLGNRAHAAGYKLAAFDSVGSTNVEAMQSARDIGYGCSWFVTTEQTAGRGRRARAWQAPRGNLASSVLEILSVNPAVAATLGFAAGVAIHRALVASAVLAGSLAREDAHNLFRLKWPNDVLADGKKLCGILLEAENLPDGRLAVVTGIGTNIVAHPDDTPYGATSLRALGVEVSAEALFTALSDSWAETFAIWDQSRGFAQIRQAWLACARGVGERVSISTGTAVLNGVFETIDDSGCLIVITDDGARKTIAAGDVVFGSVASAGAK